MQRSNIPSLKSPFKSQKRRKYRRRKKSKSNHAQSGKFTQLFAPPPAPLSPSSFNPTKRTSFDVWRKTYENLTKWQIQYQAQYWCHTTKQLRMENAQLRKELDEMSSRSQCSVSERSSVVGTEDGSDSNSDCSVDDKYLEFMLTTRKHQTDVQSMKDLEKDVESKNVT